MAIVIFLLYLFTQLTIQRLFFFGQFSQVQISSFQQTTE